MQTKKNPTTAQTIAQTGTPPLTTLFEAHRGHVSKPGNGMGMGAGIGGGG